MTLITWTNGVVGRAIGELVGEYFGTGAGRVIEAGRGRAKASYTQRKGGATYIVFSEPEVDDSREDDEGNVVDFADEEGEDNEGEDG